MLRNMPKNYIPPPKWDISCFLGRQDKDKQGELIRMEQWNNESSFVHNLLIIIYNFILIGNELQVP